MRSELSFHTQVTTQQEFWLRCMPLIARFSKVQLNLLCRVRNLRIYLEIRGLYFTTVGDAPEPTTLATSPKHISAEAQPPTRTTATSSSSLTAAPIPRKPAPPLKKTPASPASQARPPINLINSVLQKAYNSQKVPLSRASQVWDLPPYMNGTLPTSLLIALI